MSDLPPTDPDAVPPLVPSAPGKSAPRFRRLTQPMPLQLTERDLDMLRAVHRYRFLDSVQLARLAGGSADKLSRRLQKLYHNGYLDRPPEQLRFHHYQGSRPLVYGLGQKGADLLNAEAGISGRRSWTSKNHQAGAVFIEHTLLVAECLLSVDLACRARGEEVTWLDQDRALSARAPASTLAEKQPLALNVTVAGRAGATLPLGVIPDGYFALRFHHKPEGRNEFFYFLEADRGTMPVLAHDLGEKRSSIFKKMLVYYTAWRDKLHQSRLGIGNFRVLFVTTGPARVDHMIAANKAFQDGAGTPLFLFTDVATLTAGDALSCPWRSGRDGAAVYLGD